MTLEFEQNESMGDSGRCERIEGLGCYGVETHITLVEGMYCWLHFYQIKTFETPKTISPAGARAA